MVTLFSYSLCFWSLTAYLLLFLLTRQVSVLIFAALALPCVDPQCLFIPLDFGNPFSVTNIRHSLSFSSVIILTQRLGFLNDGYWSVCSESLFLPSPPLLCLLLVVFFFSTSLSSVVLVSWTFLVWLVFVCLRSCLFYGRCCLQVFLGIYFCFHVVFLVAFLFLFFAKQSFSENLTPCATYFNYWVVWVLYGAFWVSFSVVF